MSFDPASMDWNTLRSLHFLRPQWLWLLLALPLLAWLWRRRRARHSVWRSAVDPHLLPHLLQARKGVRGIGGLWLGLVGTALAVCALAGPSWNRVEQPLWQSRAPLVVVLDLSHATAASDLPPSRLLQARGKIATLLRQRAGGQVGLVVFADDAYTVAPLTDDAGNIALFLDALSPDIMPGAEAPGQASRADRAIQWSAGLLRQAGFDRGDILLLSDHADSAASSAAATAAANGYRVSALGLGTAKGAAYRDPVGRIANARLDAGSLRTLANAGAGRYAAMTSDDQDLTALGVLDPQQAGTMAAQGEKTQLWQDQGYWLLLPVLLLAAFAFRRGGALAALLLCLWLPMPPVLAQTGPPSSSTDGSWWRRPDQQQHQHLVLGAQAYRKQDYAAAEKDWRGLPGADAAYNRGNALAKQGQYDAAIAQYDEALRLQPGMEDAIANKAAVEAAKKRQPPAGKRQGQDDKQDQDKNGKQRESGQADAQDDQSQSSKDQSSSGQESGKQPQDSKSSSSKPDQADKSQPEQPPDAESQRQADAAQRKRMQQALQDAEKGKQGQEQQAQAQQAQAAKPDETPAERERRIANEAWLRRVPDDPGGLLRARFQLEYQRRQQEGR